MGSSCLHDSEYATKQVMDPNFRIGNVPVFGRVILAPMAGYSDSPYRRLCRSMGSAMSYTELVAARAVLFSKGTKTLKILTFEESERPVACQLFDSDEDRLVESARRVEALFHPDIVDVNMGCSTRRISGRGAGAALLRNPGKIGRIFNRLTQALSVPVTGKIRLGWNQEDRNFLEVVRAMQDNGAALVAVHGRTRDQGYSGCADWDAIARVVEIARIPVLGNGDVRTVADVNRMLHHTGCAGVMVGRAAVGHPWIFRGLDRAQVSDSEKVGVIMEHFALMDDFYGRRRALILLRKHLTRYFNDRYLIRRLRPFLFRIETEEELNRLLDQLSSEESAVATSDTGLSTGPDPECALS